MSETFFLFFKDESKSTDFSSDKWISLYDSNLSKQHFAGAPHVPFATQEKTATTWQLTYKEKANEHLSHFKSWLDQLG